MLTCVDDDETVDSLYIDIDYDFLVDLRPASNFQKDSVDTVSISTIFVHQKSYSQSYSGLFRVFILRFHILPNWFLMRTLTTPILTKLHGSKVKFSTVFLTQLCLLVSDIPNEIPRKKFLFGPQDGKRRVAVTNFYVVAYPSCQECQHGP